MPANAASLRQRVRGAVIDRADAGYEDARRNLIWNELKPGRRPDLIVRVESDADVVESVRFAREQGLRVAVRGGGHNWVGASLRDGGLLLDLGRLNEVRVDPTSRTAMVQPAARSRELARRLGDHGLSFPFGHCPTVAVSGYLLSGGFGWNTGAWGPACFSVRGIEVVTAAGDLITADDTSNADLLWAARGAGAGFFGIVTRFQLGLHPRPRAIVTSTYVFPLERSAEVAAWAGDTAKTLACQVELTLLLAAAPARLAAGGELACVLMGTAFADTAGEAEALLAPLERCPFLNRCRVREFLRPTPYDVLFDDMDALYPPRHRYLSDTFWSDTPAGDVVSALEPHFARAPSPRSLLLCVLPTAPPPGAPPPPPAVFSMSAEFFAACYAVWEHAADDGANEAWHQAAIERLEPFAVGHYVGEADGLARPERVPRSFAPEQWSRLEELRQVHDPDGVFHGYFDAPGS